MGSFSSTGRSKNLFQRTSPINFYSNLDSHSKKSRKSTGTKTRSSVFIRKKGHNRSSTAMCSRFLCYPISGQKTQGLETSYRSQQAKSVHRSSSVSYGDSKDSKSVSVTRRLCNLNRLNRCLPTHTNASQFTQVSQICNRGKGILFQSPTFRIKHCSLGLHKSYGLGDGSFSKTGKLSRIKLLRRLITKKSMQNDFDARQRHSVKTVGRVGVFNKQSEIRPQTKSRVLSFRHVFPYGTKQSLPSKTKITKNYRLSSQYLKIKRAISQTDYKIHRSMQCSSRINSTRASQVKTHSVGTQKAMVPSVRRLGLQSPSSPINGGSNSTMVRQTVVRIRGPSLPGKGTNDTVHRCKQYSLGCTHSSSRLTDQSKMDKGTAVLTHQRFRAVSNKVSSFTLAKTLQGKDNIPIHRQHHSGSIYKKSRGSSVMDSFPLSTRVTIMDKRTKHISNGQTHSGETKRYSRFPVEISKTDSNGMVTKQRRFRIDSDLGGRQTTHRPFCHKTQQQITNVCVSSTRSPSMGSRRIHNRLDRPLRLCLSPSYSDPTTAEQDAAGTMYNSACGPNEVESNLVLNSATTINQTPTRIALQTRPPVTTKRGSVAPRPIGTKITRLGVIQHALRSQGFEPQVVARIATARRPSTIKVYEGKWKKFQAWCLARKLDPLTLSVPQIASFLCDLFEKDNRAPSTIKGYRSMLAEVYRKIRGPDIGTDKFLSDLISNFEYNKPRFRALIPAWDLTVVLEFLAGDYFEPLHETSLRWLTLKTCFLISLAVAGRISEIHALSRAPECLRFNQDGSLTLTTKPEFVAKNRLPTCANQHVRLLPLTTSSGTAVQGEREVATCPIRALRAYLRRTRYADPTSHLWIRWMDGKPASAQTISSWLRFVIKSAYAEAGLPAIGELRAHEIRAIATSTAFKENVAVRDIIQAVGWRSESTFATHYLRDLSLIQPLNRSVTVAQHNLEF